MALHPHQARALVGDLLTPLPPETVPLEDAHHRLLAAPIYADRDLPPTDRAAMDGYACRAADTASPHPLIVTGTVAAGAPAPTAVTPGEAIRIFTGAVVPRGADCVVMQEAVDAVDNQIRVRVPAAVGQHILKRGEDARAGDELLGPGTILDAAQLAVCAAVGATAVAVRRRPRVAVFATGSELKHAADPVAPHEIRSSNTLALAALLRDLGQAEVAVLPHVRDTVRSIAAAVDAALGAHDLVVTTGGASVGDFDHLPRTMQHLGLEIHFDRLQMKPGKPVHCAMRGPAMLLALPGSPLAAFTAARLLAVAACRTLLGHPEPAGPWLTARLTLPLPHKPGRTRYVPVTLASDPDTGTARAHPVLTHSVSDMVAAGRADGMLEVPAEWPDVPGGAVLPCLLWRRWPR